MESSEAKCCCFFDVTFAEENVFDVSFEDVSDCFCIDFLELTEISAMESSEVKCCCFFDVTFEEESTFDVSFEDVNDCFCIDFGEFTDISTYEFYDGEYIVTPDVIAQYLETDSKIMRDDVTVLAVPYAEVSNPDGGLTVIIG